MSPSKARENEVVRTPATNDLSVSSLRRMTIVKDANCVANAEIKFSYLALPMQKQNTIDIDLSNISFCV